MTLKGPNTVAPSRRQMPRSVTSIKVERGATKGRAAGPELRLEQSIRVQVAAAAVGRRIAAEPANGVDRSGGALVLVDDAAEDVVTDDPMPGGRGPRAGAGEWLVELQPAVGSGFVVVAEVLAEH